MYINILKHENILKLNMTDSERINYILVGLQTNKNKLGLSLGDKNGMRLYHVLNGRNGISEDLAKDINKVYPSIDYQWILTGEGAPPVIIPASAKNNAAPVTSFNDPAELELIKKIDSTEFRYLDEDTYVIICPHVTEYAYAGFLSGYGDPEYIEELPRHMIMTKQLKLGSYLSFTVKGDSMDNGKKGCYSNGDVVTTKKLQLKHWESQLHLHRYNRFVIVTDEGISIKEVKSHDVEKGVIICHSLNEDKATYPDYEQKLSEVRDLYYVVKNTENS